MARTDDLFGTLDREAVSAAFESQRRSVKADALAEYLAPAVEPYAHDVAVVEAITASLAQMPKTGRTALAAAAGVRHPSPTTMAMVAMRLRERFDGNDDIVPRLLASLAAINLGNRAISTFELASLDDKLGPEKIADMLKPRMQVTSAHVSRALDILRETMTEGAF